MGWAVCMCMGSRRLQGHLRSRRWRCGTGLARRASFLLAEEEVVSRPNLPAPSKVSPWPPPSDAASLPWRHPPCPGSLAVFVPPSPGGARQLFSAMATNAKRKQEETHLKMLREMTSLAANRKCFDCDQRGPTYVNMTVGSFVCTTCSGILWVTAGANETGWLSTGQRCGSRGCAVHRWLGGSVSLHASVKVETGNVASFSPRPLVWALLRWRNEN